MGLKRRDLLAGMGATAVGALGMMTAEKAYAEAHRTAPLQFYGGFASGIPTGSLATGGAHRYGHLVRPN